MSATLLADEWPVARKEHTCHACFGTIGKGDTYRRQRLVWDGQPGVYKAHRLCDGLYWKMHREAGLWDDEGVDEGELRAELALIFAGLTDLLALQPSAASTQEVERG